MAVLARLTEIVFATLWAVALTGIFWRPTALVQAGALLVAVYAVLAVLGARRQVQGLCAAMAAVGVAVAWWTGGWGALPRAAEASPIFAAFFGTLALLRATADLRPEIARARALVERLNGAERAGGLMIGANLLGVVLIVSVMAVFAPIVGRDAPEAQRLAAAEACQRGMCMACLWSPYWIAMAVCYQHLPDVPLWQIMVLGFALAAVGLVIAQLIYGEGVGLGGLWRALKGFAPVMPLVGVAAALVLTLKALTPLSTLQALVTGVPALCLAGLVAQGPDRLLGALAATRRGAAGVKGEMAILVFALTLGRVLEGLLAEGGVNQAIAAHAPPGWAAVAIVVAGMAGLALIGVHQIVTGTVMLVVFGKLALGVSPLVLMEAVLVGWCFASMSGISAVSVAAAGTMFGMPLERVAYGANLRFVAAFGVVAIVALAALNAVL
jgi:hypothetical protein